MEGPVIEDVTMDCGDVGGQAMQAFFIDLEEAVMSQKTNRDGCRIPSGPFEKAAGLAVGPGVVAIEDFVTALGVFNGAEEAEVHGRDKVSGKVRIFKNRGAGLKIEGEFWIILQDNPFQVGEVDDDVVGVGAGIGRFIFSQPGFQGGCAIFFIRDHFPIVVGDEEFAGFFGVCGAYEDAGEDLDVAKLRGYGLYHVHFHLLPLVFVEIADLRADIGIVHAFFSRCLVEVKGLVGVYMSFVKPVVEVCFVEFLIVSSIAGRIIEPAGGGSIGVVGKRSGAFYFFCRIDGSGGILLGLNVRALELGALQGIEEIRVIGMFYGDRMLGESTNRQAERQRKG